MAAEGAFLRVCVGVGEGAQPEIRDVIATETIKHSEDSKRMMIPKRLKTSTIVLSVGT